MSESESRRYRFGPLERRGVIGALRPTQVAILATSLTTAVILMRLLGSGAGVASALVLVLVAVALCFWPVSGRTVEEWLPIVFAHTLRRVRGQIRGVSQAPQAGMRIATDGWPHPVVSLPGAVGNLELLAAPLHEEAVGVLKDRRARTYTAALAVKVTSFGLLDHADQESRQAGWGAVLASLAREGSPVTRIQWLERTVPADGEEIGRYLANTWNPSVAPLETVPMQSYLELASNAPAVTRDHELFVCLQIDARRGWRQIKRAAAGAKDPDAGACTVLLRELEALGERLQGADIKVVGALRPGMLASALRVSFDPWSRPGLARLQTTNPGRHDICEGTFWPLATETGWSSYTTDGAHHVTYWIAGWPRIDVGATFLSPLLLHADVVRAIAVTIEPISPLRAIREVESARTTDVADSDLRGRMGFIETARRRRAQEATARREEELADGHAAVRFAGYVTISARSLDELERDCAEIEHAAQLARLELRRLYGQQEETFSYTLPLCRGLR